MSLLLSIRPRAYDCITLLMIFSITAFPLVQTEDKAEVSSTSVSQQLMVHA